MTHLTAELRRTTCAAWCSAEQVPGKHSHDTRLRYYEALRTCLASQEPSRWGELRFERAELVAAAGARASSTLYVLFGRQAKASLLTAYSGTPYGDDDAGPVASLVAEAKAVSYWPYRQAWLQELAALDREDRRFAAETLIRVLAVGATAEWSLAAAYGGAPPPCVVEDLCLIPRTRPPADAVRNLLAQAIRVAQSPRGRSPLGTLNAVHEQLMALGFSRPKPNDTLVGELTESLAAVEYLVPRLSVEDRKNLADQLVPQLSDVLALFGGQP